MGSPPLPFQDEKPAQHGGLQKSQKLKKEVVLQLRRQPSGEATAVKRYASSHMEKQSPLTLSLFFFLLRYVACRIDLAPRLEDAAPGAAAHSKGTHLGDTEDRCGQRPLEGDPGAAGTSCPLPRPSRGVPAASSA